MIPLKEREIKELEHYTGPLSSVDTIRLELVLKELSEFSQELVNHIIGREGLDND